MAHTQSPCKEMIWRPLLVSLTRWPSLKGRGAQDGEDETNTGQMGAVLWEKNHPTLHHVPDEYKIRNFICCS